MTFFWPAMLFRLLYALPLGLILFLTLAVSWSALVGAALGFTVAAWTEAARQVKDQGFDPFALRQPPPPERDP